MKNLVKEFVVRRKWEKYHNPKDLAIAISVELGLLDIFKWRNQWSPNEISVEDRNKIGEEMADVLILLISMSNALSIDLTETVIKKVEKNKHKYPEDKLSQW